MKKNLLLLVMSLIISTSASAIPAHPGTARMEQPDGSFVTIRLHGDEFLHFNTTADGYTIVKRTDGFYAYALLDADGLLTASSHVAHDAADRTADEQAWLEQTISGTLVPQLTKERAQEKEAEYGRRAQALAKAPQRRLYDYNNFRGLIILVQYTDKAFSRQNYADIINHMANDAGYQGYDNTTYGRFTGSVRDYFYDNSGGIFSPQFDVVGPVTVNYSQYDGSDHSMEIMGAAVDAVDSLINFRDYDRDGNGEVDMVYFVVAGIGSHYAGNDDRLLWPHKSSLYEVRDGYYNWKYLDGVRFGSYACSTELEGSARTNILNGIGTICHEFGHVLGLPDLYDTDYEGSGGQSPEPDSWTIMAGGGYLNNSRTPAGYTLYERYALGFTLPQKITSEGHFDLPAIGDSNMGYRMDSPVKNEFFLIENRQNTSKWDRYLAGHGMLVFRVDSTNARVWTRNTLNCDPSHNYFVLLRARGGSGANASDPYPGTGNVTRLNNVTAPANLLTWNGTKSLLGFHNISEGTDGTISFEVNDINVLNSVTLPATLSVPTGLSSLLVEERDPDYAPYTLKWSSSNPRVVTVSNNGELEGQTAGEADITVTANDTLTATCHVTVFDAPQAESTATMRNMADGTEAALLLNGAQVVYIHNSDIYLRDDEGAIILKQTDLSLNVGDELDGHLYGKKSSSGKTTELTSVDGRTHANSVRIYPGDGTAEPIALRPSEVTDRHFGDLVTLKSALLQSEKVGKTNLIWAVDGNTKIRAFNFFSLNAKVINAPSDYNGKYFDLTGILHTNTVSELGSVDELAFTAAMVPAEAPSVIRTISAEGISDATLVSVYTADGRLVVSTTAAALVRQSLPHGIYVVKAAGKTWKKTW